MLGTGHIAGLIRLPQPQVVPSLAGSSFDGVSVWVSDVAEEVGPLTAFLDTDVICSCLGACLTNSREVVCSLNMHQEAKQINPRKSGSLLFLMWLLHCGSPCSRAWCTENVLRRLRQVWMPGSFHSASSWRATTSCEHFVVLYQLLCCHRPWPCAR